MLRLHLLKYRLTSVVSNDEDDVGVVVVVVVVVAVDGGDHFLVKLFPFRV